MRSLAPPPPTPAILCRICRYFVTSPGSPARGRRRRGARDQLAQRRAPRSRPRRRRAASRSAGLRNGGRRSRARGRRGRPDGRGRRRRTAGPMTPASGAALGQARGQLGAAHRQLVRPRGARAGDREHARAAAAHRHAVVGGRAPDHVGATRARRRPSRAPAPEPPPARRRKRASTSAADAGSRRRRRAAARRRQPQRSVLDPDEGVGGLRQGVGDGRVGARHDGLTAVADGLEQQPAAPRVELAEDVVQQQDRPCRPLAQVVAGRQEQRQRGRALLALAAGPAQVGRARADRTGRRGGAPRASGPPGRPRPRRSRRARGEGALEGVVGDVARSADGEGSRRSRPVRAAAERRQPVARTGPRARRRRRGGRRPPAPPGRPSGPPTRAGSPPTRRRPGCGAAARCAARGPPGRRRASSAKPGGGGLERAVEGAAARGGGALHGPQLVGEEDQHRAGPPRGQRAHRLAVEAEPPPAAGREADLPPVGARRARRGRGSRAGPRRRGGPPRPRGRCAARRPRHPGHDGLDQRRLAGAVRPHHEHQPGREVELGAVASSGRRRPPAAAPPRRRPARSGVEPDRHEEVAVVIPRSRAAGRAAAG